MLQLLKEIKFDDNITELKLENIKNEIERWYKYFLGRSTSFSLKTAEFYDYDEYSYGNRAKILCQNAKYYEKINIKYIETLKKSINLLKRSNEIFNNDPERINTYGDYLKKNISWAQELINSYDEKWEIRREIDNHETYDKKIHHYSAICCSLAYQKINSAEK